MQDPGFNVRNVQVQEWSIKMSLELILVYASQGSKNMEVFVSQKMNLTN